MILFLAFIYFCQLKLILNRIILLLNLKYSFNSLSMYVINLELHKLKLFNRRNIVDFTKNQFILNYFSKSLIVNSSSEAK